LTVANLLDWVFRVGFMSLAVTMLWQQQTRDVTTWTLESDMPNGMFKELDYKLTWEDCSSGAELLTATTPNKAYCTPEIH
jgi:hypothetical protein